MSPTHLSLSLRLPLLLALSLLALGLPGCQSDDAPSSYVARVGEHYLTEKNVNRMLAGMGSTPDTTEARQQIIHQWVTRTLLYRQAQRLNLKSLDEVQRKLQQQRRSVLVTAMTDRLYEQAEASPSQEEVRTYFEGHKDQLRLRQPHVKIRYLATDSPARAGAVRQRLTSTPELPDSVWTKLIETYATNPQQARNLSDRFLPEGQLTQAVPLALDRLSELEEGDLAPTLENSNQYHVLKVTGRLEEGAEPKFAWFEEEIRRRLRIRARKQTYTREVQRLRSKARANGVLETP